MSLARSRAGWKRWLKPTLTTLPAARAVSRTATRSSRRCAPGFSTSTWQPASSAARVAGPRAEWTVATMATSAPAPSSPASIESATPTLGRVPVRAAPTAAVEVPGRFEAEDLADPPRRSDEGAVIREGEVVSLVGAGAGQPVEDRRDAIGHVEVALALLAVAEDGEPVRVLAELAHEIDDVAVGVAGAHDRHEAEDRGGDAAPLGVGRDQALARKLRCAVERRLDREGTVLRRRDDAGLPVDRSRRREHQARDPRDAHTLQHVVRHDDVLLQVPVRRVPAEAYVGVRC